MEGKTLRFGIEGAWLTAFVRQQVFSEGKDPKHIVELMRGFMCDSLSVALSKNSRRIVGIVSFGASPIDCRKLFL